MYRKGLYCVLCIASILNIGLHEPLSFIGIYDNHIILLLAEGLEALTKIRFHHCAYLLDEAIFQLTRVKHTLEHLEISSCGDISDAGLASLAQLE